MLEERYSEIDRENRILLEKMSTIMRDKTVSSPPPPIQERRERGPVSLNRDYRKKELLRITKENQAILKRIQQAQPIYNHVQWEGDHRRQKGYLQNCCEYPLVLKKRTPPSSELVRLGEEAEPGQTVMSDSALDAPREVDSPKLASMTAASEPAMMQMPDDMKYVLKA